MPVSNMFKLVATNLAVTGGMWAGAKAVSYVTSKLRGVEEVNWFEKAVKTTGFVVVM